jgi:3-oxoadipate enol-lactonase
MQTAIVNNVSLAYRDTGQGNSLLMVHGFPLDHSMWSEQIGVLSRRYRVIVPDLRGFGQSGVREGIVTMEQFADDLAALLDHLQIREPVVLCGLSMGGYIAFAFWRKYAARLRALILCDTRAAADTPAASAGRNATAERVLREGSSFLAETMAPKLFSSQTLASRPHVADAVKRVILGTDPRGIAGAARGMARRPDSTPDLPRIACPTLVLVGKDDVLSPPAEMRSLAREIPNARFAVIPDAAHLAPLEQPTEVNQTIEEFLS